MSKRSQIKRDWTGARDRQEKTQPVRLCSYLPVLRGLTGIRRAREVPEPGDVLPGGALKSQNLRVIRIKAPSRPSGHLTVPFLPGDTGVLTGDQGLKGRFFLDPAICEVRCPVTAGVGHGIIVL